MPEAPEQSDEIIIITDTEESLQCSDCPDLDLLSIDTFEQAALKLYGPDAGGRVSAQNLSSYSLQDLTALLSEAETEELSQFEYELSTSDWIIFLLQEINGENPDSLSIQQLINERFDLIQQKNIIVFALNAPYYLDTTIISNVSVIYGLYSKQPQFIDVAVRLLFKELPAQGASPVSIEGTGYDLNTALSPAPDQVIELKAMLADQITSEEEDEQTTPEVFEYEIGSALLIETSNILDQNGNPVPDNTLVNFSLTTINNNEIINQREILSQTNDGVASTIVTLDNAGALTIDSLVANIVESESLKLEIIDVNTIPVETATAIVTEEAPAQATPVPQNDMLTALSEGDVTIGLWILLVMISVFISIFAYQIAANSGQIRWGIRYTFTTFIGGILMITFISSGIELAENSLKGMTLWEVAIVTVLGCLFGWLFGIIWKNLNIQNKK